MAIKSYSHIDDPKIKERAINEIKCLRSLQNCDRVVHLDRVYQSGKDRIHIVMNYVKNGTLFDYIVHNDTLEET